MKNYSVDTLFISRLKVKQSKTGYRYSLDPVLVSHFAKPLPGSKIVDLGTGCGIIPIILAYRISKLQITGVEIQKNLAELAKVNIANNNLQGNIKIISSDMKIYEEFFPSQSVDMVITNPPYTKKNSGRINPDSERAIARHEIKITLEELIKVASSLLKDNGKFVIIYPEKRLTELLSVMKGNGINPDRQRLVYTKNNNIAKLVLQSGIKNGGKGLIIEPPLYVYNDSKSYTEEVKRMFR